MVHDNVSYKLPSCVISSSSKGQRGQELVCVPGTEQRVHSCSARGDSSFRKSDGSSQSCNAGSCSLRGESHCEKERVGGAHNVSEAVISAKNDSSTNVELKDPLSNNKLFGFRKISFREYSIKRCLLRGGGGGGHSRRRVQGEVMQSRVKFNG